MTPIDWDKDLNPEQREAVLFGDGPLLVLAGAGSGKTRVLTYRYAHLVYEREVYPSRMLAVTFTNKAAAEMRARIEKQIGEGVGGWIGTFHSISSRILRQVAPRVGFDPHFTIFDADDQRSLIKSICRDHGLDPTSERIGRVRAYVSRLKTDRGNIPEPESPMEEEAARIEPVYTQTLRRMNAFDFDDLLVVPIEIFQEDPHLLEEYASRFRYLLVDEYQDTNWVQNELVRMLSSVHGNVAAVGDDDQSIYRWRGADVKNILDFEETFPNAHVIRLEQNYRSTKPILDAASAVIENNVSRRGKRLWTDKPGGDLLTLQRFFTDREEGMSIARDIQRRVRMNMNRFSDFAVFYRTNAQSRSLEDGLRLHAVPYRLIGGLRFYERKEVKDLLAYLRLLANEADDLSFARILNVPARGVGAKSREHLVAHAKERGQSLLEAVRSGAPVPGLTSRAAGRIGELGALLGRYSERARDEAPHDLVRDLAEEIGLVRFYESKEGEKGLLRGENIDELIAALADFERRKPSGNLVDFLAEVSLLTDIDSWDEGQEAVTLMTLHNSKGLEFPRVYIAGAEEGLLPHARSMMDESQLEEERRLFYVGLTRAMEKVTLSHVGSRLRYGEIAPAIPSRFLKEIPEELLEKIGALPSAGRGGIGAAARPYSSGRSLFDEPEPAHDAFPDYENESQEQPVFRFEAGDGIRHASWGDGRVTRVEGSGMDTKITVEFRAGFTKKIMVRYASLEHLPRKRGR
ncbi:MAG: UvrD-helicase domain-containing protein [Gemmatimonadetes bacterium]|nr:UvrD-helicase domain-containing protein [Gemmatimonadota bacterium]